MPLFEYVCVDCRKRFEALVYGSNEPQCPLCKSTNLERQISVFSVGAASTSSKAAAAGCGSGSCAMAGDCPMQR
jgi:putative FmdB family regulatory protein